MSAQDTTVFELADGAKQFVRRFRPSERPWGGLLLVHGIGEHSGRYEHVGRAFRDAGLLVRAFDLRGHGASDGRRVYVSSFALFLDDLQAQLRQLEGELDAARNEPTDSPETEPPSAAPMFMFGHSMGGLIALSYVLAQRLPRVGRLLLSAPALAAETPTWQRAVAPFLARSLPRLAVPTPIRGEQLSSDPSVGAAYARDPLVTKTVTARLGDELFRAMEGARERLPGLNVPTLLVHGGEDTLVPTRATEVAGALPVVRRIVYDGMRHELHNEPGWKTVMTAQIDFLRSGRRSDASEEDT